MSVGYHLKHRVMCKQQGAGGLLGSAVGQLDKIGVLLRCKLQSGKSPPQERYRAEKRLQSACWMWGGKLTGLFIWLGSTFNCILSVTGLLSYSWLHCKTREGKVTSHRLALCLASSTEGYIRSSSSKATWWEELAQSNGIQ